MPFRLGKIGHTLQQKPNDRQEAYVRHREKDYKKKKKEKSSNQVRSLMAICITYFFLR